jgi:LmbE family N-acetylglucosaminyl deacetylase
MIDMSGKSILVITPHPDDAESGAGATITKWARQGASINLVVCTNGDKGTSDRSMTSQEVADIRRKEQLEAANLLGIKEVIFLGHPDQHLIVEDNFRRDLVEQIRRFKPEIVITIDPERKWIRHADHYITGRTALDAIFPYARDHLAYPSMLEQGMEPHKVAEIYLWGTDEPDVFIDIDDAFDNKIEALYCHKSQMSSSKAEGHKRLRMRFSEYGYKVNAELAEPFKYLKIRA